MSSLVLLVPGRVDTLTGGYAYDRQMVDGLRRRGWSVVVRELDGSFPQPTAAARSDAVRALAAMPDASTVLIDGLAPGVMPDETWREARRLRVVGLVHHPLAAETGLEPHIVRRLEESERRALAAVHQVIVTSRATAAALDRYGVAANRIAVVEPGTERAPLSRGSQGPSEIAMCGQPRTAQRARHAGSRPRRGSAPGGSLTCVGITIAVRRRFSGCARRSKRMD